MAASPNEFIEVVARARDLNVKATDDHHFWLEPRQSPFAWHCELDDGFTNGEDDPTSFVRWVCPALRIVKSRTPSAAARFDVRRSGPHTDLGRLAAWVTRRAARPPIRPAGAHDPFVSVDPDGIVDDLLRQRIEHWPAALHGDGVVRPAELSSIQITAEGLVATSVSWWGSAPTLDHHLALAIDIATRMTERQASPPGNL